MEYVDRYNRLNKFLKNKFGERVLKICIDGNFTCPNRDSTKGINGCIFCSERGSGDHLKNILSIESQVKSHLNSYKATRANKFIVYFQNFTNTYDSLENLKKKYDSSLIDSRIVALAISTRPDCINEDIVKLIASYKEKYYVWVELGLQTSNEKIGEFINRKYSNSDFTNAVSLLNKYNIDVVAHIMIGLPNETRKDIINTTKFLNSHNIQGLKIHSTYITENTKLAKMYLNNEYTPITFDYYLDNLVYILTHIKPNIVIHRLSGDAPKDILIAPKWNIHKKWVINGIYKKLQENDLYQGIYYENQSNF